MRLNSLHMKQKNSIAFFACLLFTPVLLLAQNNSIKTIPGEIDFSTAYYILDENSDSTECYLYLFEASRSYMLIINHKIAPDFTQSYIISQGNYAEFNAGNRIDFTDDTNLLVMRATQAETDDLIFEEGLGFMIGSTFAFVEKTTQLPGPPHEYTIFSNDVIYTTIDKAQTTEIEINAGGSRYQTKMFSDCILADLQLKDDQTFSYRFMHYPLLHGIWKQENRLITFTTESGLFFYGAIRPTLQDFVVIQLPGFLFEASENNMLYKVK